MVGLVFVTGEAESLTMNPMLPGSRDCGPIVSHRYRGAARPGVVDHPQIDIRREPFLAVGLGAHRVEGILHVGSR